MTEVDLFFYVKGLAYLVATLFVIVHMSRSWSGVESLGRRLRYYILLGLAINNTGASVTQAATDDPVQWWHVTSLGLAFALVVVMVVSIREDARARPDRLP